MALPRRFRLGVFILAAATLLAAPARGGDVTVFMARPQPSEDWDTGYGAALSSTWLRFATFEAEVARLPGVDEDSGMRSFTASALLTVPIASVTPYGGVGVGVFRQTIGDDSDTGTLKAVIVGAKLQLGGLVVVRGDYRRLTLSGPPPLPMDERFAVGLGVSF